MKLAHIVLKTDRIGNSVPLNYVTPAEVMFLTADHHRNAGGNPIVTLEEIEEKVDKTGLLRAEERLANVEARLQAIQDDSTISQEVMESRLRRLQYELQSARDTIDVWKRRLRMRTLDASTEKRRLSAKYGSLRVERIFPGQLPTLPEDFDQAAKAGVNSPAPTPDDDKFILMAEGPR